MEPALSCQGQIEWPATPPTVLFHIRNNIHPSKSLVYKIKDNFLQKLTEVPGSVSVFLLTIQLKLPLVTRTLY